MFVTDNSPQQPWLDSQKNKTQSNKLNFKFYDIQLKLRAH